MKILGYNYTILFDTDSDKIGSFGRQIAKTLTIQIASDLDREQTISTVLHEIFEALNYHLQLNLTHNVVMGLEAGLYQALSDNGIDLSPLLLGQNQIKE